MNQKEINNFIESFKGKESRTIVIVDFGNVDKWQESLRWKVGIQELARLIKHFSIGNKELRRFYYGMDYMRVGKKLEVCILGRYFTKWYNSNFYRNLGEPWKK